MLFSNKTLNNHTSVITMFLCIINFNKSCIYFQGLEAGETGTVRRRQKTVVTPKMAMESFRYSFMSGMYT